MREIGHNACDRSGLLNGTDQRDRECHRCYSGHRAPKLAPLLQGMTHAIRISAGECQSRRPQAATVAARVERTWGGRVGTGGKLRPQQPDFCDATANRWTREAEGQRQVLGNRVAPWPEAYGRRKTTGDVVVS